MRLTADHGGPPRPRQGLAREGFFTTRQRIRWGPTPKFAAGRRWRNNRLMQRAGLGSRARSSGRRPARRSGRHRGSRQAWCEKSGTASPSRTNRPGVPGSRRHIVTRCPLFHSWIGRENRTQSRTNLRQRKILEKYLSQNATRLSASSLPDLPNSCINEIRKTAYIVSSKTNDKDRSDGQGKRLLRAGHHVKHR
jgi:hypothetical protein